MPHKSRARRQRARRGGRDIQGDRIETITSRMNFEVLQPVASGMITGSAALNLNPFFSFASPTGATMSLSGDNKLISMSQLFQFFRISKIRMRMLPSALALTAVEAAGTWNVVGGWAPYTYISGGSQPSTYSGCLQLPYCTETICLNADGGSLPSVPRWYTVPKRLLTGVPFKWYNCFGNTTVVPTNRIPDQYYQGNLWWGVKCAPVASSLYVSWGCDLEVTVQFKDFWPAVGVTYDSRWLTGIASKTNKVVEVPVRALITEDDEKKEPDDDQTSESHGGFEEFLAAAKDTEFDGRDATYAGVSSRAL